MSGDRRGVAAVLLAALACGSWGAGGAAEAQGFPPQLEMTVPHPPTPVPSGGGDHLIYEIYLRNFGGPITLSRLEALDAGEPARAPLAAFDAAALAPLSQQPGRRPGSDDPLTLAAGASMIVYMSIALEPGADVPDALRHRVFAADSTVEGAVAALPGGALQTFTAPLGGAGWIVSGGPDNDSGHRRGMVVIDGRPQISRRYAMDWMQAQDGATFAGDARDNTAYFAYGEEVLAVADGVVVDARGSFPENIPGERPAFSIDAIPGNFVTLDLGNGTFARYLHLQTGSVRVETGDRVRQGEVLGLLGNSGDSSEPHLHFEVTTAPGLLGGEGAPYVLDEFWIAHGADAPMEHRVGELPWPEDGAVVSFDPPAGAR